MSLCGGNTRSGKQLTIRLQKLIKRGFCVFYRSTSIPQAVPGTSRPLVNLFLLFCVIQIIAAFMFSLPLIAENLDEDEGAINLLEIIEISPASNARSSKQPKLFSLGGNSGVMVENISPDFVEVEPHQIISITFMVSNETESEREFTPEVLLPDGWLLVTSQFPFMLKPAEEKFIYLAVGLPLDTDTGDYTVSLHVRATESESMADIAEVKVHVLAVAKFDIVSSTNELRVIAGEKFTRSFVITNNSNSFSRFEVKVDSNLSWPFDVVPDIFSLETGESETLNITVETPGRILVEKDHRLTIEIHALDLNHGTVSVKKRAITTIHPGILQGEMYETLDGYYSLLSTVNSDGKLGAQFKLDLEGILGSGKWTKFNLSTHYPSEWGEFRFLQEDYFNFRYVDEDKMTLNAGDDSYQITELTQPYFYGRGIDLKAFKDPFTLRVFTSEQNAVLPSERMSGVQLSWDADKKTQFTLSHVKLKDLKVPTYLDRQEQRSDISTLRINSELDEGVNLLAEYGVSSFDDGEGEERKSDNAYYIAADVTRERFRFSGKLTSSGENYPGYWMNSRSGNAHVSFKLTKDLNIWGNYSKTKKNLSDDPDKSNNLTTSYDAGINFPAGFLGRASIYERWRNREDTNLFRWNEKDRSTNIRISRRFDDFSLTGSAQFGERQDLLTGLSRNLEEYQLMLSANLHNDSNFSCGVRWDSEDSLLGDERYKNNQIWANTELKLSDRWDLKARYNRSFGNNRGEINWFRADMEYQLGKERTMQTIFQHQWGYYGDDSEVALMFTFPLSIPMPWVPKCGRLEGYVYSENGKREPLADVIVSVGTMKVATNKNGKFIFPALDEGDYYLDIEEDTIDFGLIPDLNLPCKISISPGQTLRLDMPLVQASSVRGNIILTAGRESDEKKLPEDVEVINDSSEKRAKPLFVVLTSSNNRYERTVEMNGEFDFKNLRPDHYKLFLVNDQIPKYHELNISEYEFDLDQGQEKQGMDFVITPVEREILITFKEN